MTVSAKDLARLVRKMGGKLSICSDNEIAFQPGGKAQRNIAIAEFIEAKRLELGCMKRALDAGQDEWGLHKSQLRNIHKVRFPISSRRK
jgi:hypothetical protein